MNEKKKYIILLNFYTSSKVFYKQNGHRLQVIHKLIFPIQFMYVRVRIKNFALNFAKQKFKSLLFFSI